MKRYQRHIVVIDVPYMDGEENDSDSQAHEVLAVAIEPLIKEVKNFFGGTVEVLSISDHYEQ